MILKFFINEVLSNTHDIVYNLYLNALVTFSDRRTSCKITVTSHDIARKIVGRRDIVFSSCSFGRKLLPNVRNRIFLGYDPSHGRERGSGVRNFFSLPPPPLPVPAAPLLGIPRRHTARVARVMWHVSDGGTKAHNARVARTIHSGCTGMWRPPPSRHLRIGGRLHFLFSRRWSRIVDATERL